MKPAVSFSLELFYTLKTATFIFVPGLGFDGVIDSINKIMKFLCSSIYEIRLINTYSFSQHCMEPNHNFQEQHVSLHQGCNLILARSSLKQVTWGNLAPGMGSPSILYRGVSILITVQLNLKAEILPFFNTTSHLAFFCLFATRNQQLILLASCPLPLAPTAHREPMRTDGGYLPERDRVSLLSVKASFLQVISLKPSSNGIPVQK